MKKSLILISSILFVLLIVSCNNKTKETESKKNLPKATNLEELKDKYANIEFDDCEEFLEAGTEMIDVYIETIDRAYEGDEEAKSDLDRFDTFMNQYDALAEEFSLECPEKFEAWADDADVKVSEASNKLFEIYKSDYEFEMEYDEELEKEIQENVDELNEELEKILAEDTE